MGKHTLQKIWKLSHLKAQPCMEVQQLPWLQKLAIKKQILELPREYFVSDVLKMNFSEVSLFHLAINAEAQNDLPGFLANAFNPMWLDNCKLPLQQSMSF